MLLKNSYKLALNWLLKHNIKFVVNDLSTNHYKKLIGKLTYLRKGIASLKFEILTK